MVKTKDLVSFLKSKSVDSGFIDQLKVNFRPLISPYDELINQLINVDSVFDIGCGSGQFILLLAEFTSVKKIGGVEIDNKLIDNAKELLKPYADKILIDLQTFDGSEIPSSISNYNVVLLIDVLHHIPSKYQLGFLRNIYERMGKGSLLIIKDINASNPLVIFNKLHDLVFSKEIGNEWGLNHLKQEVEKIGCKVIDVRKKLIYVYPHYTITLEK